MALKAGNMYITYTNGNTVEGFILGRTDTTIRAVVKGADDVVEFNNVRGTWISDDCEPVRIEFAWQRQSARSIPSEAECICPPHLASRLIHLLYTDSPEDRPNLEAPVEQASRISGGHAVV
ncbi:MAG TPA: hypothetical protein VE959_04455 [Bryobacteraceae bacterium]|nr:hypothetical protein [Bryobacteraceae bacterium]